MAAGNWAIFDRAILKVIDNTIDLDSHAFKVALLASAQALTAAFVGSSADARYADLTAEFSTANGYTAGGAALASVTLTRRTSAVVMLDAADPSWTLTGAGLTGVKYLAIYDDTAANKDLLCFLDLDTSGGTVNAPGGPLSVALDANGILQASR